MAAAGIASRRACEELIEKGQVKVNGLFVKTQGTTIDPNKDRVEVSGKKLMVAEQPSLYYFAVNKPKVSEGGCMHACYPQPTAYL